MLCRSRASPLIRERSSTGLPVVTEQGTHGDPDDVRGPPRATARPATLSICRRRQRPVTTGNRDRREAHESARRRTGTARLDCRCDPRRSRLTTPRNACKCEVGPLRRSKRRGRRQMQTVGFHALALGRPACRPASPHDPHQRTRQAPATGRSPGPTTLDGRAPAPPPAAAPCP